MSTPTFCDKRGLVLIICVALLAVMGVSITLPILPKLAAVFQLSGTEVGLLITCFTLPSALMTPLAGVLADRFGRKLVLLCGLMLFACGGVGCALSDTFTSLLAFRAVQGLGAAPLGILYTTLVGDFYEESERTGKMGMVGATISLGTALYPALGGVLGELDWRLPFWVSLSALPVALFALSVPLARPQQQMDWKAYGQTTRDIVVHRKAAGLFALTFLCFSLLYGSTITCFPLLADTLYTASPAQIGMVFAVASLGTAFMAMSLSLLGERYPVRGLMLFATGCYLCGQGLLLLFPSWREESVLMSTLWILILPIFLGGVAQGVTFPLLSSQIASLAPTKNRAIVMAINGTVLRVSQSVAPLAFGFCWTVMGWQAAYGLGLGLAGCVGLLTVYVYPRNQGAANE